MDKQVSERIKYLVAWLNICSEAYDRGEPLISDTEWDNLYFELKGLEEQYNIVLPNSPTQIIPYVLVSQLNKKEHNHPMLSLDKTKSEDAIVRFVGKDLYVAMCKMDGLTCSLTYNNGELVAAETRGDGLVGEDILHNARVIPTIPKKIPYMDEIVIDGEIICTYADFEEFKGEYKNPRNFAAGSIRLLSASQCADRSLRFVAWDVITSIYNEDEIEYRVDQKLNMLQTFGFEVVPFYSFSGMMTDKKVITTAIEDIKTKANKNSYPIDGVVFKFSDCAYGRSLGATSHHFNNAIAFKFADESYESTLLDIEWSMGRTGQITPIAIFEPIEIDGSIVSRSSLHNLSIMEELNGGTMRKGDTLFIFKANQIIPQVSEWKTGEGEELFVPTTCPCCGEPVEVKMEVDSKVLYCPNLQCSGRFINKLEHFCSKKGLDIKGLSKATLEKLINWGWVENITDLFELSAHRNEWVKKAGFGVKSVDKIIDSIAAAANCELHQFIAALGIPLIGSTASKDLSKHFQTWENFIEAVENNYDFYNLPNFGGEMYKNIIKFNYTEAKLLVNHYIKFNSIEIEEAPSGADLSGKVFCITGKLNHYKNRDEIKNVIESLGGKVSGSVSKKTDYLINNDTTSTSSKNQSAKSFGVPIISEEEFVQTFISLT